MTTLLWLRVVEIKIQNIQVFETLDVFILLQQLAREEEIEHSKKWILDARERIMPRCQPQGDVASFYIPFPTDILTDIVFSKNNNDVTESRKKSNLKTYTIFRNWRMFWPSIYQLIHPSEYQKWLYCVLHFKNSRQLPLQSRFGQWNIRKTRLVSVIFSPSEPVSPAMFDRDESLFCKQTQCTPIFGMQHVISVLF